jgi:hypothetical protein
MVDISAAATSVFRPVMVMLRFSLRLREFALAAAPARAAAGFSPAAIM